MVTLSKVKDTFVEKSKLIIKVLQFGAKTAKQVNPFGIDANPLDNYTAIYSDTSNAGESLIIGYINKNYITEKGEIRLYSLNDEGEVQAYAYCRKNGVLELNGSEFSAVRFENLQTAIQNQNSLINAELVKIASSISDIDGVYVPGTISTNLTSSKSPAIKLK
jgi:hypothetical protein